MKPYSAYWAVQTEMKLRKMCHQPPNFLLIPHFQFSPIKVQKSSRSGWSSEEDGVEKNSSVNKDEKLIGKNW